MARYNYSTKATENMAKAVLRSAPISTKHSIEICNMIRGKTVKFAKSQLEQVVKLKIAVPFKRFNADVGHRPGGMGPGRYPIKASQMILDIIASAEANAQFIGLNKESLVIKHISSQKASRPMRGGNKRGQLGKRTNIEIVVEELAAKTKDGVKKKSSTVKKETKTETKTEVKPEVKTEVKSEVKVEKKIDTKNGVNTQNGVKEKSEPVKETPKVETKTDTKSGVKVKSEVKVETKTEVPKKEDDKK